MTIFRSNKASTSNKFLDYSINIYQDNDVKDACLFLQNRYKLNVNLILCCIWSAASGQGILEKSIFINLNHCIQAWHTKITLPLRKLRQLSKKSSKLSDTLYQEVLALEIYSEIPQQKLLYDYLIHYPKKTRSAKLKCKNGIQNITNYFSSEKIMLDEEGYEAARKILAKAFPTFSASEFPQMSLLFD